MRIRVHKIASVVYRAGFEKEVEVTDQLEVKAGNSVVVRALREKRVYSDLELDTARMAKIFRGDVFIGDLGRRRALRGFCGELPSRLRVGDHVARRLVHRPGQGGVRIGEQAQRLSTRPRAVLHAAVFQPDRDALTERAQDRREHRRAGDAGDPADRLVGRVVLLSPIADEVRDQDRVACAGLAGDLQDPLERHGAAVEELEPEVGGHGPDGERGDR